jgi:hypothetical protein
VEAAEQVRVRVAERRRAQHSGDGGREHRPAAR